MFLEFPDPTFQILMPDVRVHLRVSIAEFVNATIKSTIFLQCAMPVRW